MIFRLIYKSRSLIPAEQTKWRHGEIFSVARSNNKRQDITGALLVADDGRFVQALEGDEGPVQRLFDEISADERHSDVTVIDERRTDERTFGEWSMAHVGGAGSDIPLLVNRDRLGYRPKAERSMSADQQVVLDFMLQSARTEW